MFAAQEKAEAQRILFEKTKAQADQQTRIIQAEAGIQVAKHEASQMEERARGTAAQTRIEAEAEAGRVKLIGESEAGVIASKGEATAEAYRKQGQALTPAGITSIEVVKLLAEHNIKITPDVIAGGDSGNGGGLVNLLLADMVQRGRDEKTAAAAAAPAVAPAATDSAKK
jgi:uncharacterized membrane protein YqiK